MHNVLHIQNATYTTDYKQCQYGFHKMYWEGRYKNVISSLGSLECPDGILFHLIFEVIYVAC